MLRIKQIQFSRQKPIIDGVTLNLKNGSFLGIVGPSGAGKSTLLKIIAGLLDADSGHVSLDGETILGPKDRLIPGHPEIRLVDQHFDLDRFHTVEENMRLQLMHLPLQLRTILSNELLELMELIQLKKQKAGELSGGEQQRLALARALASEPKVLLLDEPFAHLDTPLKRKVISYLTSLRKIRKTSFVLVSHDGREMLSLADEIAFFDQGKIRRIDSPFEFYNHAQSEKEGLFFGEINHLRINRKSYLFRPDAYQIEFSENHLALEIKFRKSFYFGLYELEEYLYKNQSILLQKKENQGLLKQIYISNIETL